MPLGLLAKDSIQDFSLLVSKEQGENSDADPNPAEEACKPAPTISVVGSQPLKPDKALNGDSKPSVHLSSSPSNTRTAANPQQAQEEVAASRRQDLNDEGAITGQYSGFHAEYYDANGDDSTDIYHHDPYAPMTLAEDQNRGFLPNLVCCLFPWMGTKEDEGQRIKNIPRLPRDVYGGTAYDDSQVNRIRFEANGRRSEEDEQSSNSDALGEKLSRKDRQAVLARLGLAQPDATMKRSSENGVMNGIPTFDTSPLNHALDPLAAPEVGQQPMKLKGILKRKSIVDLKKSGESDSNLSQGGSRRRSLFPQHYERSFRGGKKLRVTFTPMARVVTVKSRNEMAKDEKTAIWWQKSDYEDFRKTGRIITRAMMEGGSEIWLSSQNTRSVSESDLVLDAGETTGDAGDKWWHRFGHSRRGLEHVVSIQEGRERQLNVRSAIRSVVEEQSRQRAYRREDTEKLRIVALNLTSWARDLALAAGASDADAVKSAFAEDRKSREFYLLKMSRNRTNPVRCVPGFMQPFARTPPGGLSTPRQQQRLDANTSAQIRFRQRQQAGVQKASTAPDTESTEPIRDPASNTQKGESLAHRAAGYMVDGQKLDVSMVLTGMGTLPKEPAMVAS